MNKEAIQVALVITAAGTSSRFNTGEKKEFLPLSSTVRPNQKGGTVLSCSTEAFLQFFLESKKYILSSLIITITNKEQEATAKEALLSSSFVKDSLNTLNIQPFFILGSTTRQQSVFCALSFIKSLQNNTNLVLIHDAARPFLTTKTVASVVEMSLLKGASVPSTTPVDTQKEINSEGMIVRHLTRANLAAVQTPQGFHFDRLVGAHEKANNDKKEYTDDTEIWGTYVGDVYTVKGFETNTKITFKQDMENTMAENYTYRTGLGTDFHRLEEGRKLMIGGIEIPFEKGEAAHSDGDVLLHAITDSLLGAVGMGDIGELFPPSDNKWKDADSKELLQTAWKKVQKEGWHIQNIDCVMHMEKPKFLPWREKAIESIASILECEKDAVFVKAKTGEGLGDIGEGKAISAQVICLLKKKMC